jgi:YidC/Oxa1 family membrane protein insertase
VLDPLYNLVARGVIFFHNVLAPIFGKHSFFSYAIAIAIIVVIVRIIIFPLFVRSVRAQRTMQMLQPRIKEIREKYKNDKQRMNQEVMKLQKEHGNPLLGCLPLLLQIPLFIALYHVFNAVSRAPHEINSHVLQFKATSGLTGGYYDTVTHVLGTYDKAHDVVVSNSHAAEVAGLATAKVGGITLSSALTSSKKTLELFGANGTTVKVVAGIMIVLMCISVYITQRQIMARGGPVDPSQQKIQRVMLYGSPLMLAIFGFRFPIAVLVYWLTTNVWSMAQQVFILRKMPPVLPATGAGSASSLRASAPAPKGKLGLRKGAEPAAPPPPTKYTQVRKQPPAVAADKPAADGDVVEGAVESAAKPPPGKPEPDKTDTPGPDLTKSTADPSTNGSTPPAKQSGGSTGGKSGSGAGRSVSGSGQGSRPRRPNRPAAKPKGKGPRKGGRR